MYLAAGRHILIAPPSQTLPMNDLILSYDGWPMKMAHQRAEAILYFDAAKWRNLRQSRRNGRCVAQCLMSTKHDAWPRRRTPRVNATLHEWLLSR